MPTVLFVSYEVHPTTWGGCGVLLHHAAEALLRQGHKVVFLLDIPDDLFDKFNSADRLTFPNPENCKAYSVRRLCDDCPLTREQVPNLFQWQALRFRHAHRKVAALEAVDFTEFFEYCGPGYYTFADRLFGVEGSQRGGVLGSRLHTSIELLDACTGTRYLDEERYTMYGLERRGLDLAEVLLTPTRHFFEQCYTPKYALSGGNVVVSEPPKLPFPRVARRPSGDGPFNIVTIGRMYQFKGVDTLVHAGVALLKRRPGLDCRIVLYGADSTESPTGGSYADYLRTMIPSHLRDRFVFPGQVPHARLAEELNDALFAVFPNRFESFCYALHEVYDAGVPIVCSNLPAFTGYFQHERNALVFDGSTERLAECMERMIDDAALRERLAKPYEVATAPLGDFYEGLRKASQATPDADRAPGRFSSLIAVLVPEGSDASPTLAALGAQSTLPGEIVVLREAHPDAEETFWWLGRPWHARDTQDRPIDPTGIATRHALAVLLAGDVPAADWLALCTRALHARTSLGFAGTWASEGGAGGAGGAGGRTAASTLDLTPETWPFENPGRLTRALIRTEPGHMLVDLFDPNLGPLGEIGCLWQSIARRGHGCILPEVRMTTAGELPGSAGVGAGVFNGGQLKLLVARYGGPLRERLALYAAIRAGVGERGGLVPVVNELAAEVAAVTATPPPVSPTVTTESRMAAADELGGRTLVKLALRKIGRRIRP